MNEAVQGSQLHSQPQSQPEGLNSEKVAELRLQFPLLAASERPVAYFDSASTSQRPAVVLDAMEAFHREANANVHRGVYSIAVDATQRFEDARRRVAEFLGAADANEVVFVRGVTEAVNLVAQSFVRPRVGAGDEILITVLEHHSNFVPWQMVAEQTGATLVVVDIDDQGDLDLKDFEGKLTDRTRFASITGTSNAIGTVPPLRTVLARLRECGVPVLVDGAQTAGHGSLSVADLGADFYAVSGHKMYGPTGIGALWGRGELLASMPPYQGGGDMIREVRIDGVDFAAPPARFEAGTPNIAGAIGLGAAAQFVQGIGREAIVAHEAGLLDQIVQGLSQRPGIRIVGQPARRASVVSFVIDGVHAQDAATLLDNDGICVRVGHHCAQPLLTRLGEVATLRASVAAFNDATDVERLLVGLDKVQRIFGG